MSKYPVKYKANETISNKTITTLNTNHAVEDGVSLSCVNSAGVDTDSAASDFDLDDEKEMGKDASLFLSSLFVAL